MRTHFRNDGMPIMIGNKVLDFARSSGIEMTTAYEVRGKAMLSSIGSRAIDSTDSIEAIEAIHILAVVDRRHCDWPRPGNGDD